MNEHFGLVYNGFTSDMVSKHLFNTTYILLSLNIYVDFEKYSSKRPIRPTSQYLIEMGQKIKHDLFISIEQRMTGTTITKSTHSHFVLSLTTSRFLCNVPRHS